MMVIEMIEETFNQPFKTGALIDQQGNYALFDILMNRPMFEYIRTHKLYSKTEQMNAANSNLKIDFPAGTNPPDGQVEGAATRAGSLLRSPGKFWSRIKRSANSTPWMRSYPCRVTMQRQSRRVCARRSA
jgi:hypothetical protein